MRAVRVVVLVVMCARPSVAQEAQRLPVAAHSVATVTDSARAPGPAAAGIYGPFARIPKPLAPVASAIVPGLGQLALQQDRFLAYLAVEAYVLGQYVKNVRESNTQERNAIDLAVRVARSPFSSTQSTPGAGWDYYETLEEFSRSGKYSLASGQLVPDTTTGTYNAFIWHLARLNHWANPDKPPAAGSAAYLAALAEYTTRAAKPGFEWSWVDNQLEQDLYRAGINKRNDATKRATWDLSIVMANHILSMIDAFATVRVESMQGTARGARVSASIPIPRF